MADVVQYKLERMLNELDDLERRGLFSRREIAEIVKQRRKFEYRLKRPSPLKQDFLAYIDYEKQLDKLRLLRKKAQYSSAASDDAAAGANRKKMSMKKSVSDYAGVSKIIEIYRLATMRFKGDIELWFQYLEFCRERRNGRMRKALAQAIRFHPKVPGLWIYAAAWEFDHNLNAAAARALMQSGLRACPASEDLWVEYLRMELTYLNKLKARKVALGEDEGTLARDRQIADEKQWKTENKELFMSLDEKNEDKKASNVQDDVSEAKLNMFREHGLNILRTVYSGAVEALPSSFSLRFRFLEILEATDLAHSEDMRKEILVDMEKDFSTEPEYWDWLARYETVNTRNAEEMNGKIKPQQLTKAIQIYENGIRFVPSAEMFHLYAKFLMDAVLAKHEETRLSEPTSTSADAVDPISYLLMVYGKAESMGCMTEDLACQYTSFLLQLGRLDEAKSLVKRLCTGKLSDAIRLWELRLSIDMRCAPNKSLDKDVLSSIFDLLRNVLKSVPISDAENLWCLALKFFSYDNHLFDELVDLSTYLLAKGSGKDNGFSLSSTIVNYILQRDGILRARSLYERYLALPHPGLALYENCIELEMTIASADTKFCLRNVRKLYESALDSYSQEANLWRGYYLMEVKMGTSETAAAVQWRARKALNGDIPLVQL